MHCWRVEQVGLIMSSTATTVVFASRATATGAGRAGMVCAPDAAEGEAAGLAAAATVAAGVGVSATVAVGAAVFEFEQAAANKTRATVSAPGKPRLLRPTRIECFLFLSA